MEEADQLCDRVAIMDHGRMLALDTPDGLKASVDADTVVEVTTEGDLGRTRAGARRACATSCAPSPPRARRASSSAPADGIVPRVVAEAEAHGFPVTDLSVTEPTLETVFINLTGKDLRE